MPLADLEAPVGAQPHDSKSNPPSDAGTFRPGTDPAEPNKTVNDRGQLADAHSGSGRLGGESQTAGKGSAPDADYTVRVTHPAEYVAQRTSVPQNRVFQLSETEFVIIESTAKIGSVKIIEINEGDATGAVEAKIAETPGLPVLA
jgi:hypothetical protein